MLGEDDIGYLKLIGIVVSGGSGERLAQQLLRNSDYLGRLGVDCRVEVVKEGTKVDKVCGDGFVRLGTEDRKVCGSLNNGGDLSLESMGSV